MQPVLKAAAIAAIALAAAGCQVNVDENTAARIENAADRLENVAEGAAVSAENAAEGAAAQVENAADRIGNADIDVDVKAGDGNAAANSQ